MQHFSGSVSINQQEWRTLLRSSVDFARDDFSSVVDIAYRWIAKVYRRSFGMAIPARFATAPQNEYEPPGHAFSWVTIHDPADGVKKLFSAKVQHPDSQEPSRFWVTEFEIVETDSKTVFGLRLAAFGREVDAIAPAAPKLLVQLAERGASHANLPCSWNGKIAQSVSDVELLADFVHSADRVLPLVIVSERINDGGAWRELLHSLARKLGGVAIVVGLDDATSFEWARVMGPHLHVFNGALRVYLPNTGKETFAPLLLHGSASPEAREPAEAWVVRWVLRSSATSRAWVGRHAFYQTARELLARQERKAAFAGGSNIDSQAMISHYEEELSALLVQLQAERTENKIWVGEIEKLEDALDELNDDKRRLLYKLATATRHVAENYSAPESEDIPGTLEEIRDWYEDSSVNQRLYVATRALREAQQSLYNEPDRIYEALLFLANEYRDMRLHGTADARNHANARLQQIGWQCEGAGGETTLTRDDYRLLYNGRWLTTELHLTKGGGRDPRYNARIYFTWDNNSSMCVVGWLPTHLENTLT